MPDRPTGDRDPQRTVPDLPVVGTRGGTPKGEETDGVVLFDPAPPSKLELPDPEPPTQRRYGLVAALLVVALGAGGYLMYARSAPPPVGPTVPAIPPETAGSRRDVLDVLGGPRLEGQAGYSVNLDVRVTNAPGVPLADTVVTFRVLQGGGLLSLDAVRTDSTGLGRATLILPRRVGPVMVLAELAGTETRTTISIEARSGTPATMSATDGNLQTEDVGELLPARLTVTLLDRAGNPVPGSEVRFEPVTGGGIAAPMRARTDSLGEASARWRLGPEAGTQELAAVSTALGSTLTFTATARGLVRAGDGTPVPVEAGPVTVERSEFIVGGSHVCQLSSGSTRCRGANDRGQRGAEALRGFSAIATGVSHVCGLDDEGTAMCWGANEGGQLGDGSRTDRPSPVPVRTELRFSSLTAGTAHTCGLAGGGIPLCWGQNLSGQLGDGSRNDARAPRAVGGGVTFRDLAAGWSHTCGLTTNGNAFCWGLNGDGQLGDGSRLDRLVPTLARGAMETLAAGSAHTCGISERQVLCWGDNRFGQVGDGSTEGRPAPTPVVGLPSAPTQIAVGAVHTCALVAGGAAYCWGQNRQGQLGDGSTQDRSSATPVAGSISFRSIHAGGALTCGFATDGSQYCWGLNQSGQLGDGSRESRRTPTAVRP